MKEIKKFFAAVFKPDTFITFLNYALKIVLNPVVILLIPVFLTEEVQGYWFTFGSIAALTNLADMGFTTIVVQFAAHECAFLKFDPKRKTIDGDIQNCYRLSSLFRCLLRWTSFVTAIAAIVIFVVGIFLFSSKSDGVVWFPQWSIYVVGTVTNFAAQVVLSFFEGCNQFLYTQRIRIASSTAQCLVSIIMLWHGCGLYALSIALVVRSLVIIILLFKSFGPYINIMRRYWKSVSVPWMKEILPLLGKYAVSWTGGYFAQQIYNPLAFSVSGSAAAGKVGYGLSIVQAIASVAGVWNFLSIPQYNMEVEKRSWSSMDRLLRRNILYSEVTFFLGYIAVLVVGRIGVINDLIWGRTLPIWSVSMLFGALAVSTATGTIASYLRAHKQEPLMYLSVANGVLSSVLTVIITIGFGINFIFLGYFLTMVIILPWILSILRNFRKKWHTS